MALECYIGPEQNLLEPREENAHRLRVPHPILTNDALTALKYLDYRDWRSRTIDITFQKGSGKGGLLAALDRICNEATTAIKNGIEIIILSDRLPPA